MKSLALVLCWIAVASATVREPSPNIVKIPGGLSGSGHTTHYWDCCVPACSFPTNMSVVTRGVVYCLADGVTEITDYTGVSECYAPPGTTYTCNDNQPWIINSTLAYGFTAASFQGGVETGDCCKCLLLSFQGALAGKQYLAQITNTGSDLTSNHFDIQMPGGGVGIFNGCQRQWNTGPDGWGERYGGVTSEAECSELPAILQEGCRFRWTFLNGVENPDVTFEQVVCPQELIQKTSCQNVNASATGQEPFPNIVKIVGGLSGSGHTTHYWDCCVPACSFPTNMSEVTRGVVYCLADGVTEITDYTGVSECYAPPGTTYTCNDNQPWIINSTLAYGFTAVSFQGGAETGDCCKCILLSFQGDLAGKQYLAQITNTGTTLTSNHFDIQMPGGGVGIFNGCQRQWNTGPDGWGERYGGVTSEAECSELPEILQEGCRFRWTFMNGVENPNVTFEQVVCPQELTQKTNCQNVNG